jgi:glycosyltransferase involved in cell wall biosynthesis
VTLLQHHINGLWRLLRTQGTAGVTTAVARRLVNKINEHVDLASAELPVRPEDLADSSTLPPTVTGTARDGKLRIGWVCAPPAGGSGGHTTLFRMVEMAEQRGHECTLFLYDKNSDDVARHEEVVRRHWKNLKAEVRSATTGMDGIDAVVASSWGAAHVVATRAPQTANKFYFIQDFEPYFYPRGALYSFAEDTYRFGFTNIALGEMIASRLRSEIGVEPNAIVPFGCDDFEYRLLSRDATTPARSGVVYYAKRNVDRRGYLLAKLTLEKFHKEHPEQEIHVFGDRVSNWSIPVTNHGTLSPQDLNVLYNRTIASLTLSFTNISLVPEELMAAGNVPVLNEHPFSRAVLSAPHAIWTQPSPVAMAKALSAAVTAANIDARARLLSAHGGRGWRATAELVAETIEGVCAVPALEGSGTRLLEPRL